MTARIFPGETIMTTISAQIRAKLDHPLIDGDSHIIEYTPVLMDFIKEAGGEKAVADFGTQTRGGRSAGWYQMNWDERRYHRTMRAPWWALPTKNTLDRCTAMLPKLYHERMDDFGLDFAVLYPTAGLGFNSLPNDETRQLVCHAYNEYVAAAYAEYSDRMTPAAIVPMSTPEEGIRELEHAKTLGLKVGAIWATHYGSLVPVNTKPPKGFQYPLNRIGDQAVLVRVFYSDNEAAATAPGEEPVEQGGSNVANVGLARGAGCISYPNGSCQKAPPLKVDFTTATPVVSSGLACSSVARSVSSSGGSGEVNSRYSPLTG